MASNCGCPGGGPIIVRPTIDLGDVQLGPDHEITVLCDATGTAFLRAYTYGEDGSVTTHDTGLDGASAFTPTEPVGLCQPGLDESPGSPGQDCCPDPAAAACGNDQDEPGAAPLFGDAVAEGLVSDTDPTPYQTLGSMVPQPGGGNGFWTGGQVTLGPDTAPAPSDPQNKQLMRTIAAHVRIPTPDCQSGNAVLNLSWDVEQLGPDVGVQAVGGMLLLDARGRQLTNITLPHDTPVGYTGSFKRTAIVNSADLADGALTLLWFIETFDSDTAGAGYSKAWRLSNLGLSYEFDTSGCPDQKEPATRVTVCGPVATRATIDVEPLRMVDATGTAFVRHVRYDGDGVVLDSYDTDLAMAGYTPEEPVDFWPGTPATP